MDANAMMDAMATLTGRTPFASSSNKDAVFEAYIQTSGDFQDVLDSLGLGRP